MSDYVICYPPTRCQLRRHAFLLGALARAASSRGLVLSLQTSCVGDRKASALECVITSDDRVTLSAFRVSGCEIVSLSNQELKWVTIGENVMAFSSFRCESAFLS